MIQPLSWTILDVWSEIPPKFSREQKEKRFGILHKHSAPKISRRAICGGRSEREPPFQLPHSQESFNSFFIEWLHATPNHTSPLPHLSWALSLGSNLPWGGSNLRQTKKKKIVFSSNFRRQKTSLFTLPLQEGWWWFILLFLPWCFRFHPNPLVDVLILGSFDAFSAKKKIHGRVMAARPACCWGKSSVTGERQQLPS